MKLRKKLLLIFLVFLVLITLVIIISKDNKEDKNVVRFGYAYNIGQLPGVIGVEKGFFSQQGLEINSLILEGGKDITEAMLAGEIDFGLASSGGIIPAAVISDDIKIVATTSWWGGRKRLMIRKDLKIDNFPELINKKIAVRIGGTQYKNLLKLIDKSDLTKDDFKILNMKNSDAMVVLQIGDIDAYLCGEPDCAIIEYKGIGYELLNFDKTEIDPNFLMVRKQFMEENPDLVVRFLKGWINYQKFINSNFSDVAISFNPFI